MVEINSKDKVTDGDNSINIFSIGILTSLTHGSS